MLENVAGIHKVVLACGTVDLRKGIDGLQKLVADCSYREMQIITDIVKTTVETLRKKRIIKE